MDQGRAPTIPNNYVAIGTGVVPLATPTTGANLYGMGQATNSYPHGLSYVPTIYAFVVYAGLYKPLPFLSNVNNSPFGTTGDGAMWQTISVATDTVNVQIVSSILNYNWTGSGSSGISGISVRYYLSQPTSN